VILTAPPGDEPVPERVAVVGDGSLSAVPAEIRGQDAGPR
jgi:hypothetical protein